MHTEEDEHKRQLSEQSKLIVAYVYVVIELTVLFMVGICYVIAVLADPEFRKPIRQLVKVVWIYELNASHDMVFTLIPFASVSAHGNGRSKVTLLVLIILKYFALISFFNVNVRLFVNVVSIGIGADCVTVIEYGVYAYAVWAVGIENAVTACYLTALYYDENKPAMICNALVFPISGYIATGLYKPYILNYAIPVLPILLSISNPMNLTIVSF